MPNINLLNPGADITTHAADLNAHTQNVFQVYRTGEYHLFPPYRFSGTLALSANQLQAHPFVVSRAMTFDRIGIHITVAAGTAKIRLGIYNDGTNLYPGTLVIDGGELTISGTGVIAATISQALTPGLYWFAWLTNGTDTAKGIGNALTNTFLATRAGGFDVPEASWRAALSYAALPDPFTAGGALRNDGAAIGLRVLSLD